MLEARIEGQPRSYCGWYYGLTEWCTYENSDPRGDSAFIVNLNDDEYDDKFEVLWEDALTIHDAVGQTIIFVVEVSLQNVANLVTNSTQECYV